MTEKIEPHLKFASRTFSFSSLLRLPRSPNLLPLTLLPLSLSHPIFIPSLLKETILLVGSHSVYDLVPLSADHQS